MTCQSHHQNVRMTSCLQSFLDARSACYKIYLIIYLFIYFASPGSYVYKKTLKTIQNQAGTHKAVISKNRTIYSKSTSVNFK